jgi:hypothetical protein
MDQVWIELLGTDPIATVRKEGRFTRHPTRTTLGHGRPPHCESRFDSFVAYRHLVQRDRVSDESLERLVIDRPVIMKRTAPAKVTRFWLRTKFPSDHRRIRKDLPPKLTRCSRYSR